MDTGTNCTTNFTCAAGSGTGGNGSGNPNDNIMTQGVVENPYVPPLWVQFIYYFFFITMIAIAVIGNAIIIWIVLAHSRMRTVTNYFLVNLALSDFMIAALNALFNMFYLLYGHWPFGRAYCKLSLFTSVCAISSSVLTFMAIAIDRYTAIIHPLKPRMSRRTAIGAILVIWLMAICAALPNLIVGTLTEDRRINRLVCYLDWPDGAYKSWDFSYSVILLFLNYIFPLVVCTIAYARIGKELWGSRAIGENTYRQGENIRSKRKVVKMMIFVVLLFALCWLPQHCYFVIVQLTNIAIRPYIQHVYLVIYWLAMSNSMFNAFIYCWMNNRFREGFRYVFRWLPCITWQPSDVLGRGPVSASVRQHVSMTETTRCERNGSLMASQYNDVDNVGEELQVLNTSKHIPGSKPYNMTDDKKKFIDKPL